LSRLLPGGVAERLLASGRGIGETERLNVTVVMSDIRGYSTIAEHADPSVLAGQLNRHRAEMNRAIIGHGGTVMQYVGDAVMAVFGAPEPIDDHADRALAAAVAMHAAQRRVNEEWIAIGVPPFELGIGLSTGDVAAALLGSEERAEYTVVGDSVNLCQRLQQFAANGQTVLSEATWDALRDPPADAERLPAETVKGRDTPVQPYRIGPLPP
jgi:class 3 adenylate cyclase